MNIRNLIIPIIILIIWLTGCVSTPPSIKGSILMNDLDAVMKIISRDKSKINHRDDIGRTPLHWAAYYGNFGILKYLVDQGVLINVRENTGETPLHWAAAGGNFEAVKYLVSHGANVNAKGSRDGRPLHRVTARKLEDHIRALKFLVSQRADVNARDEDDVTPLYLASTRGNFEAVKYLVSHGANVNVKDKDGKSPLHAVLDLAFFGDLKDHIKIIKYLISKKADLNIKDNNGVTPLYKAAARGYLEIVKYLISEGASLNIKNNNGETPLDIAKKYGRLEVVTFLSTQTQIVSTQVNSGKIKPQEAEREKQISDTTPPAIYITSHDTSRGVKIAENKRSVSITGKATDKGGLADIKVNNVLATVDGAGNFRANISLVKGKNEVLVVAADIYENKATKKFTITRIDEKPVKVEKIRTTPPGKYYALIIGNNNYKYIRNLETAINDAKSVKAVLDSIYGFKTQLLLDASRNVIVRAINKYRKILKESDNFLIYYAGHGEFDKTANKAYWLPIEARGDDDTDWILSDRITSNVKRFAAKHILIVADSCYSGTLTRRGITDLGSGEIRDRYLQKMDKKPSRTLLASGGDEPVSDIGGKGHSVFAAAFIDGLKEMEQKVFTAEELYYEHVKERVAGNAEQTPEYNIIRNSGHNGGDFLFVRESK